MYTLTAQNEYGQQMELTNNNAYVISSIVGLDPPDSVINFSNNANDDGSVFNSSRVDNRTITITLAVNAPTEANRINLYTYFKSKKSVRLYYTNDTRDVYIDGYVQRMNIGFFDMKQVVQIVIICPKPFFSAVVNTIIDFSTVESLFEFPFAIEAAGIEFSRINMEEESNIYNGGDVETGFIIKLNAIGGSVVNPAIYNIATNEFFKLNITMQDGDEIIINTKKKEKSVMMTAQGVTTNIIGDLVEGSTWFQLLPQDNSFTATADANPEYMLATCTVTDQFEGV